MSEPRSSNVLYGSTVNRGDFGLMPNSERTSGCDVASVTVCPRPHAVRATAAPVRPEKMLVTHRTRSIIDCVLPAVTKKFISLGLAPRPLCLRTAVCARPIAGAWGGRYGQRSGFAAAGLARLPGTAGV